MKEVKVWIQKSNAEGVCDGAYKSSSFNTTDEAGGIECTLVMPDLPRRKYISEEDLEMAWKSEQYLIGDKPGCLGRIKEKLFGDK